MALIALSCLLGKGEKAGGKQVEGKKVSGES
jgi:hypothetical protein